MRGSAVNSSKVKGPGSHRMGWLGWAGLGWAGLQRADLSSAESFHALRPRPAGCGSPANHKFDNDNGPGTLQNAGKCMVRRLRARA